MKWFRFSLLSLMAAVLVAGVFLWANMTTYGPWFQFGWGWPQQYWYWSDYGTVDATTGEVSFRYFSIRALVLDAVMATVAVMLVGVSVEWAVRRHHRSKWDGNQNPKHTS